MSKPDCKTCGACCWSFQDREVWCDLTEKESTAFSPQFRARNVLETSVFGMLVRGEPSSALRTKWVEAKAGPLKGMELCVCCQLNGSLLHRVKCRIYENRPSVCRKALQPGDRSCLEARALLEECMHDTK
jgi:Fe-S-cluster containining protein